MTGLELVTYISRHFDTRIAGYVTMHRIQIIVLFTNSQDMYIHMSMSEQAFINTTKYKGLILAFKQLQVNIQEIASFRYRDNFVHVHGRSPFWVGIFITLNKENYHVHCLM